MSESNKYIPTKVNTDLSENYFDEFTAKFLKNVTTGVGTSDINGSATSGQNTGALKPLQSNEIYCDLENEPDAGQNICVGARGFPEVNRVYVFAWNPNNNHFIYRINGDTRSCEMVKIDPCFNFQLDPKYFIHDAGCWLEVFTLVDPETDEKLVKEELYWTDGFNYQGYLRPQDCIDTNGFDEVLYPYFQGDYDRCNALRMGVPTPKDCIQIEEIPVPELYEIVHTSFVGVTGVTPNTFLIQTSFGFTPLNGDILEIAAGNPLSGSYTVSQAIAGSGIYIIIVNEFVTATANPIQVNVTVRRLVNNDGVSNNLLFNTWQFRIEETDVWGRPSEWGIISDMYIPGINDCISVGSNLASCLNLIFSAGNPFTNSISISWRNCNDEQWRKEETLFLYVGSNIGKWWLRPRNPDINYDPVTNKITYKFCRDKECDPVDPNETNRLQNPLPKTSQSLFKLNNALALANNKDGFNPISKTELDKIKLTVIPPGAANPDTRNITIYVAIDNMNQQVFPRNDKFYYGGQLNGGFNAPICEQKKQFFKNTQQSGFCGVLVNGPSAISTQVYIDGAGNVIDDPSFNGYNLSPTHRTLQKFVFNNVPKGSYIFYITSPIADPSTESNYRKTSVPIWGLCPFNKAANYSLNLSDRTTFPSCELYIDACASDYDSLNDNKMLVIANMANAFIYAQLGYISESSTNDTRWELLRVQQGGITLGAVSSLRTDRNGFYWIYKFGGSVGAAFNLFLYAWSQCARIGRGVGINPTNPNIILKDYTMDTFFVGSAGETYVPAICNTIQIRGRILIQGTSIGVSNATVALTRGGEAITDDDGFFSLICHDDASNINISPTGDRKDKLIISGGACTYESILPSGCLPVFNIVIVPCAFTGGACTERIQNVGTTLVTYTQEFGLLSGGTYLSRANFYDWLGRKTFSQPLKPLQIPSIIQSQAIGASTVIVDIDPTFNAPLEFKYFTISLTEETTIEKYLTWIVDRVEFIDNTNAINNIAPTQIKIYYQSVTEFAAVNNYNVTTQWSIIPQGETMPVISDKVQFWLNGDGKFFTKNIVSLIKYAQDGTYFTIDYTSELRGLQQNAVMRMFRPKTCTGTEPDFEVCHVVNLVEGKAQENQFRLNAFDTYYLSRQFPVPAPVAPTPKVIQIATTTGNTTVYTEPVPVSTVIENRNIGVRFEHNSPSNFWGAGCKNIGRPNAKNNYECELIHPNQIAFGGTLSVNGQLNFLSYFSVANKHDVEIFDNSGIVAVIPFTGLLLIITRIDNVIIGFNDNLARVNENGTVQVPSGANTFGQPERKVGDLYGCDLKDKMSIKSRNGLVMWASRSRGEAVQYNFRQIQSLTKDDTLIIPGVHQGKCDAMFRTKVKYMDADPSRYFTGAIDPILNKYILTDFKLTEPSYINDLRDYSPLVNETLQFDILTRDFLGWLSFTAENYAYLDGNILNNQLFSFRKGTAWSHYNVKTNNSFNTFYGTICEKIIYLVASKPAFTKKQWLTISNYCKQSKYFADLIVTEAGQKSMLFLDNFDQADFFSFAPFLCDVQTPSEGEVLTEPLYEGNPLYGLWIAIRLISDPQFNDKYSEFVGSTIEYFINEKTG